MAPYNVPSNRPENVGVLAMEVYFPTQYVTQTDLENYYGVSSGKYTLGLGQEAMAFTGDREDVNSVALSCVSSLLEKYDIDPADVGRVEVGTETLIDHSKSTKTEVMALFEASGNADIEGVTSVNACYGGTAALLNSVAWVESSAWDGRYALVVAADIAVYASGAARPTGGMGAVAMLIGPDAPLVMDSRSRTTHAERSWDFYKPDPTSEYPTVDGAGSQKLYLHALDDCYSRLASKQATSEPFSLDSVDYALFHSPYNKLVQKAFGRLLFLDSRRPEVTFQDETLSKWQDTPLEDTLTDRDLDLAARNAAKDRYKKMVEPSCRLSKQVGNTYAAAVYVNLASLVHSCGASLENTSSFLFSFGSGSMATSFLLHGRRPDSSFTLERMASVLNLQERLDARTKATPKTFEMHLSMRERLHGASDVTPTQSIDSVPVGAYYLSEIDTKARRTYARKEADSQATCSAWNTNKSLVVAGISAGAPGHSTPFNGDKTLDDLLAGVNCIQPLSDATKDDMLARRLVIQSRVDGKIQSTPVESREDCIQVAAVMEPLDLVKDYNLPQAMVNAMDEPTQLAVAAGLNALKNASLVSGENGDWKLPQDMQSSVGIVYATSFPTMDATVSEVSRYYTEEDFHMDRKLLYRLLVLANAQLAQVTGAQGPNTQVNAACAGATQAIGIAQDWITLGKCDRVIIISSDAGSNSTLFPWIGSGFRALGAASTAAKTEEAALPFDAKRNGMILGAGAIGMVLESVSAHKTRAPTSPSTGTVRLLATHFSNSAYHGSSLKASHLSTELDKFLNDVETKFGITRAQIAREGVYYSHETFTNASPTLSCAYAEVSALRHAFGDDLSHLTVANTKGFTGHPMSVAFEDIVAVHGLHAQRVPPMANFAEHDEHLGEPLTLSTGGELKHSYALRFAAGFGSQLAYSLYAMTE